MKNRPSVIAFAPRLLLGCTDQVVTASCPPTLAGWTKPKDGMDPHGWLAEVTIRSETVLWDGKPVEGDEFQKRLRAAPKLNPVLHILFDPTGARSCRVAEHVRDEIDRIADCRGAGLCGQGTFDEFKKLRDKGAVWRVKMRGAAQAN